MSRDDVSRIIVHLNGWPSEVQANDRPSCGHRLQHHITERFMQGRMNQHIALTKHVIHVIKSGELTDELHSVRDPKPTSETF